MDELQICVAGVGFDVILGTKFLGPVCAEVGGDIDVFDEHWEPLPDAASLIEAAAPVLKELTEECERFLLSDGAQ